ncbi:biopolymer transporter ExbD [Candidatus Sumerlaeota bacterium]|nr:biopolymer transporter ExbD [Candidatus Sumerlaeota bacterium]
MRNRRAAYGDLYHTRFDAAALIAVALVLAACFALAGGRGSAAQFDVSLAAATLPGDDKLPTIAISRDGQIRLNGRPLSLDELQVSLSTLRQQQAVDRVVVTTNPGARLQVVLEAMGAIKAAGINRVAQRIQSQEASDSTP